MGLRIGFCVLLYILANLQPSIQKSDPVDTKYVAAVVEYSQLPRNENDTFETIANRNAENYCQYIKNASSQGADIIVFPECGLVSLGAKTEFASPLPEPSDKVNPCTATNIDYPQAIKTLSCQANQSSIYVLVNLPEVVTAPSATFYYNTDIVFDRGGTIIAKYRKYNLFGEPGFNITSQPDYATFDTDFGVKFGIFTCFDIIFQEPAVNLVKEFNVTDILFPTAWFSELPFLTAVQTQASWARGLDVNFLGAGYDNPSGGSGGSGIYPGNGDPIQSIMPPDSVTKVLIASVTKKTSSSIIPVSVTASHDLPVVMTSPQDKFSPKKSQKSNSGMAMLKDYIEPYETVLLTDDDYDIKQTICQNDLCCDFEVIRRANTDEHSSTYLYRLAVFDGVRSFSYKTGGIQTCAVLFCTNSSISSCGEELEEEPTYFETFDYISISGTYRIGNTLQLPNTLMSDHSVLSSQSFKFEKIDIPAQNVAKVIMYTTQPVTKLMTFAIYGRDFLKDGQQATKATSGVNLYSGTSLIFVVSTISYYFMK